jgi:hypothetical protein
MSWRQEWMVEIVLGRMDHADFLHHPPRAQVGGNRKGDDLVQCQMREAKFQSRACAFCGVTTVPVVGGEAPADLDAGHERRLERRNRKSDEPGERGDIPDLNRPEPKPVPLEMSLNAVGTLVARCARQDRREKLHNSWIGVESGKGFAVIQAPTAETKSGCLQLVWKVHSATKRLIPVAFATAQAPYYR